MPPLVIAVTGATGAQGGGLVRAILDDPTGRFAPRAVTRDPSSPAAAALAAEGVEVVVGDSDDVDSLATAFAGAHGAYCVTNFWEHFSPDREGQQAGNLAEGARRAGVAHAIWSTLEDTRAWLPVEDPRMPTLQGAYNVPHFDAKGQADARWAQAGVPTTYLRTSFYWDNLVTQGMGPVPADDGTLTFALPLADAALPGIAAGDIGGCALGVFADPDAWIGQSPGICGAKLTGAEMAAALGAALGREVTYRPMEPDAYRALGFLGADDLGNMFQVNAEFADEWCGGRDVEISRALHPGLASFEDWAARNADRLAVPVAG